jgi:hypothetical protein
VVLGNSIYDRSATAPRGSPIQRTQPARGGGSGDSQRPDFAGGNVVVTKQGAGIRGATSEKRSLKESAAEGFLL